MASKSSLEGFRKEVSQKVVATESRHFPMPYATIPVIVFLLVSAWVGIYGKPADLPTSTVEASTYVPSEDLTGSEAIIESGIRTGKKLAAPTNEAAPVGVTGVREDEAEEYIRQLSATAVAEMHKFGIPASITLAQGLVESRAGTSRLARTANNHFGIKCFSKKCEKGHCINFTDDTHKDFFVKYPSRWGSFRAHSHLLSGRYAKLKKHGRDYRKWAYGLKSLGYATDRTYAEKLIGIIERYELQKFDK